MSIHKLPEDIICKIFSLAAHDKIPPYLLPESDFGSVESHPFQFNNVSPDILAGVCKRWRAIALSDPVLWSTLFLSLRDPAGGVLRRAGKVVAHCIERSKHLPLSCFLSIDTDPNPPFKSIKTLDHKLIYELLLKPWLVNQHRWRCIDIHFPRIYTGTYISDHGFELRALREAQFHFVVTPSNLHSLEAIRLDTEIHQINGLLPLSSCAVVKLDLHKESEAMAFLYLCPNAEKLAISALERKLARDRRVWHIEDHPITFTRLRSLTLDAPLSALRLLSCPLLEDLTITGGTDHFIENFYGFISRGPPFRTFRIRNAIRNVVESATRIPRFLSAIPSVTHLALSLEKDYSATALQLFQNLSKKHDASSDAFRFLPSLERVELIGPFFIPLPNLVEFVMARWRVKERTLASLKLKGCFIQTFEDPEFINCERGMSAKVCVAMKPFVDEGLVLEIS